MSIKNQIQKFDAFTIEKNTYDPGLYLAPHKDATSRISIILKGCLSETAKGQVYHASPGSLVCKPNNIVHENLFGAGPVTILSISFNKNFPLPQGSLSYKWLLHPKISVLGVRLWAKMQQVKNDKDLFHTLSVFQSHVKELESYQRKTEISWVEKIRSSLENNLSEAETIQLLSKQSPVHRVHLSRVFKREYKTTPLEYRKYARLAHLVQQLLTTNNSLASIAFDAGYSDQSHMSRTIKKEFTLSCLQLKRMMHGFTDVANVQD